MTYLHLPSTKEEAAAWNFPLGISGFRFADLNRVRKLMALDAAFLEALGRERPEFASRLKEMRANSETDPEPKDYSETLIAAGAHLGPFIASVFGIDDAAAELDRSALSDQTLFDCRRDFIYKRVVKTHPSEAGTRRDGLGRAGKRVTPIPRVDETLTEDHFATDPEREFAEVAIRLERKVANKAAPVSADVPGKIESVAACQKPRARVSSESCARSSRLGAVGAAIRRKRITTTSSSAFTLQSRKSNALPRSRRRTPPPRRFRSHRQTLHRTPGARRNALLFDLPSARKRFVFDRIEKF